MMRPMLLIALALSVQGCATAAFTGAVVGTTAKVGVLAVKGTTKAAAGTGKLVYSGAKAVAGSGDDEPATRTVSCDEIPDPKPQTCLVY